MKQIIAATTLIFLLMLSFHSMADTIILKNGRHIDSTKCWEDGDFIKCKLYGQTVGYHKRDIAEVRMTAAPAMPVNGFRFDIWQSGITVHQAIDIAEANDLPFHKAGLISSNKRFNSKVCRPYADTTTRFGYQEMIFNKMATLNFDFTPASKKLYSLEIKFLGTGISKQSEFRQQIESILREKYGKPFKITDHIIYKDFDWKINRNAIVRMQPMGNAVIVTYRDIRLTDLAEKEKLGHIRSGFTNNEKSKF